MEGPYQRPAQGPREVRAPHQPREGGEARTPSERERTHTQRTHGENLKGNRTEPAERTDRMEWRTSEREEGTPRQDSPPHTAQETLGGKRKQGGHNTRHRPQPPRTGPPNTYLCISAHCLCTPALPSQDHCTGMHIAERLHRGAEPGPYTWLSQLSIQSRDIVLPSGPYQGKQHHFHVLYNPVTCHLGCGLCWDTTMH